VGEVGEGGSGGTFQQKVWKGGEMRVKTGVRREQVWGRILVKGVDIGEEEVVQGVEESSILGVAGEEDVGIITGRTNIGEERGVRGGR